LQKYNLFLNWATVLHYLTLWAELVAYDLPRTPFEASIHPVWSLHSPLLKPPNAPFEAFIHPVWSLQTPRLKPPNYVADYFEGTSSTRQKYGTLRSKIWHFTIEDMALYDWRWHSLQG